jgi:malonate-semialdehyde dehydrogenase (acetylating)/methylmalonate-semialdehyde dehydrogenase
VEFCIGAPHLLKGEFTDGAGPASTCTPCARRWASAPASRRSTSRHDPDVDVRPAIACGNAFILKPSERAPSVPMMLAKADGGGGLPKGILQVVNGDKESVDAILDHPVIQAWASWAPRPSRSTSTGACCERKRVQAFGGAKNHMIVMPDAGPRPRRRRAGGRGLLRAGERCMAISVAVPVGEETADRLIEKLVPRIEKLKVGPLHRGKDVDYGPVITAAAKKNILALVESGVDKGASS